MNLRPLFTHGNRIKPAVWVIAAAVLLLIAIPSLGRAAVQDAPMTLDSFWKLVEETQSLANRLGGAPDSAAQAELGSLVQRWEDVRAVLLPDGSLVPVQPAFLLSRLKEKPTDAGRLSELLGTLLLAREGWPQGVFDQNATNSLAAILEKPEFQWKEEQLSPLQKWWQDISRRFLEWLANILGGRGVRAAQPVLRLLFITLGILVIGLALSYALRAALVSVVSEAQTGLEDELGGEILTAETAYQRAQALSSQGDRRQAIRYLYLSSLLLLEERGLLRFDRAKTNREVLKNLEPRPELAEPMRAVVEVFDRTWYGYQPVEESEYSRYVEQVVELRQQR